MLSLWLLAGASADSPRATIDPRFLPTAPTLLSQAPRLEEPEPLAHPL